MAVLETMSEQAGGEKAAAPTLNLAAASARKDCSAVFKHLDADESGMLDVDEIKEALEEEGIRMDPEELEAAVSSMDPSGDEFIDEDEFLEWWRENEEMRETMFGSILRKLQRDEKLKGFKDRMYVLFDELDEDEGGFLEQHELTWALTKAFSKIGIPPSGVKTACDAAMKEMDEDGDDQIDFDEFYGWCANNQEMAQALEKSVLGAEPEREPEPEPEPEQQPGDAAEISTDGVTKPKAVVVRKYPNDMRVTTTGLMQAFRRERAGVMSEQPPGAGDDVLVERIQDQQLSKAEMQVVPTERAPLLAKYAAKLEAAVADGLGSDDLSAVKAIVEAICRVVEWEGLGAPDDESYWGCRAQFAALDEDGSGELEEEEIRVLAEELGNKLSDAELEIAMKAMDADGSGAVDFAEFYEWWSANKDQEGGLFASIAAEIEQQRKVEELRAEAREMFQLFDDDSSGSLDKGEVRKLAQSMGMNLNAKELDDVFSQMDTSGDGDVDFDEFFAVYAKIADPGGGMFYSVTRRGTLDRMKVHMNELRRKFVPTLTFRREAAYAELETRDAAANKGKMSKTEQKIADKRKMRGYQLEEMFNEMDTSGDGALDKEEIGAVFTKMGVRLSQADLDAAMAEMDVDKGGDVDFDEFKQWWDRNIESADDSSNPVFVQLRAISDDKRHKLKALKQSLYKFTGIADDAFFQALYDKEEASARIIREMIAKEQELERRAQAAIMAGKGGTGPYVPRAKPADFDTWPIFKQKAWLLEEERRKRNSTPYQIMEKPADFDDWPYLKQQMWEEQQRLARIALESVDKTVSQFRGIVLGFSELAVSWTWPFGDTAQSFQVYISHPDDDALAKPSRLVATVPCIPSESQYRSPKHFPTVKDLEANTLYKFGIVVQMTDGTVVPMATLGHRMVVTTAEAPKIKLKAVAHGFAETHISWEWVQPNAKQEGAVGESITLYRTANFSSPELELTPRSGQLADVENSKLDSAVIQLEPGVTQYGPYPMFPLWKPPEALFSFGAALKMRLPEGSRATHRTLPLQIIKHRTPPEPEFAYIHATPLSFSDVAIRWGWNTTETSMRGDRVEKFVVFRSQGREPTPEGREPPVVQPTIEVATVPAIDADATDYWRRRGDPVVAKSGDPINDGPVVMHYRDCVAANLGPAETLPEIWGPDEREYTFGIVVHFHNGLILDMRTTVQKTSPQPSVDYFVGETLSWSALSLSWGWSEKRQLPVVPWIEGAECFAICRSEDGVDKDDIGQVELPAPSLELASRQADAPNDDHPDYVVTGLGPTGLCSLTDGMEYNFSIVVKMKNGVDLPAVTCTAWTAPRTFLDWTAEEVALWVRLDVGYPKYADTFLENDVSGAVAAVLTGEDMELDLKIWAWSPRMAILLAIKVMVENARSFGHRAIGYQQANVERTERRNGAVWDAVKSVDGGPLWWRFSTEVVWGPDIPTTIGKPWHEEALSTQGLAEPTQWNLPPSTFKLRSHADLRATRLRIRPTFFKRDAPGGEVDWKTVDPPPRAVEYADEIEGVDATEWAPKRRRRGLNTVGPVLWAAQEAGMYVPPEKETPAAVQPPVRAGAILPDSQRMRFSKADASPSTVSAAGAGSADESLLHQQRSISPPSEPPSESPRSAAVAPTSPVSQEVTGRQSPLVADQRKPHRVAPHRSRPFKDWDAIEVSTWVKLVLCMPEHSQAFLDNDVNGELATMLGAEELQEDLGVASAADRLKILTAIGKAALRPSNTAGDAETSRSVPVEQGSNAPRTGTLRADANIVQQSLKMGKYRPATGPIATALRAAALERSSKDNASTPATNVAGAKAVSRHIVTEEVDSSSSDAHWWRFVSDVTSTTAPADDDDASAQLSPGALPWELAVASARTPHSQPSTEASEQSTGAGWFPGSWRLQTPRSADKPGLLPRERKPKEWERVLNSATIRDLRQAPDWASAGSPRRVGGSVELTGELGVQLGAPPKGRLSEVAKSIGR